MNVCLFYYYCKQRKAKPKMHNNLACLIILWIFSHHLLRNFYVDIFFLVSIFNSYLQIVKIRTRHVRLHKNPSNNSVLLFKNFFEFGSYHEKKIA